MDALNELEQDVVRVIRLTVSDSGSLIQHGLVLLQR